MGAEEAEPRIGGQFIELERADSTNKTAAELLRLSKVQHGAVILAHEQTAGRGQRGRSWVSVPGLDLTFSVVLLPTGARADGQFALAKLAALAVHDAVADLVSGEVRIKWPNDVLVADRKVAGILIECELVGDRVRSAIVGVGLNVNGASHDVGQLSTSLCLERGALLDRREVMTNLIRALSARWDQWRRDPSSIDLDYRVRLWSLDRPAAFVLDGQPLTAKPLGVDEHGRLLLDAGTGDVRSYGLDRLRFAPRG